jgi:hypothetical protein
MSSVTSNTSLEQTARVIVLVHPKVSLNLFLLVGYLYASK